MTSRLKIVSEFSPKGDQPKAINELVDGLARGLTAQTLLGVTGSGKTYTMAKVIEATQKPTLIIVHNKTLAAQLYSEFRLFFPNNAVEYFVSYYDYYQPEAYMPKSDTYIEKDANINDEIDKLRHSATRSLFERRDVVIVASVSCIYGLGSPEEYLNMKVQIEKGQTIDRDDLLDKLVSIQYERNNLDFKRGTFRVNGDVVEIMPIYASDTAIKIDFFGDEIDGISRVDSLTGKIIEQLDYINIYPGTHYVISKKVRERALVQIVNEMKEVEADFIAKGKLIEAQRIQERCSNDVEMIKAIGYCAGVENYSRFLSGRQPGQPPPTLLEYMPEGSLIFIDESHQTIPQLNAMLRADQSRKSSLVEFGFRLPSAYDNRPLSFKEFNNIAKQIIFVSATPSDYELDRCDGVVVEQVVRPTGLVDPRISIRPVENQVDDLLEEIRTRAEKKERVLVGALTKRQAEDLTDYYQGLGVRARYLHSDIATLERIEIINDLRIGEFDVLIGINLLREGLDIPEVSLVAILNADMEGFLRSETSLIQTSGRAARNINGLVIFYADKVTGSIKRAVGETSRRRKLQLDYNKEYDITPTSTTRKIDRMAAFVQDDIGQNTNNIPDPVDSIAHDQIGRMIEEYDVKMKRAASNMEFETAAMYRDKIKKLKKLQLIAM
ncbi:MAG TPA: excinuclease ABC subunit UvrB [Nitrospinota bacterium]|nr:excinuclease ABC subunit UvrB [Nitrospinota bacterium]